MGFLKNIEEIRARARQQIVDGPVIKDYKLDLTQAVGVLNEALGTELVCILRYKFH
jgi:bacterioferritin